MGKFDSRNGIYLFIYSTRKTPQFHISRLEHRLRLCLPSQLLLTVFSAIFMCSKEKYIIGFIFLKNIMLFNYQNLKYLNDFNSMEI